MSENGIIDEAYLITESWNCCFMTLEWNRAVHLMPFLCVMHWVWTFQYAHDKMISRRVDERNAQEALDNFLGSWALFESGICWRFWFSMVYMMGWWTWGCNLLSVHWVGYDQVYKQGSIIQKIMLASFLDSLDSFVNSFLNSNEDSCVWTTNRTLSLLGTILGSMLLYCFEKIVVIFLLLFPSSSFLETTQLHEVFPKIWL